MSVYSTLQTRLLTVPAAPAYAYQNTAFKPDNRPWMRSTLLAAEPAVGSIGASGYDLLNGLYQVDIFTPLSTSPNYDLADAVVATFPRGLSLSVQGKDRPLRVMRSWVEQTRQDNAWFIISVVVRWYLPDDASS